MFKKDWKLWRNSEELKLKRVGKFKLPERTVLPLSKPFPFSVSFYYLNGSLAFILDAEHQTLIAPKGVVWDGCSPKVRIGDWILGVWDGAPHPETFLPKTYWASLIHDLLCLMEFHPDMPFNRAEIDEMFYEQLQKDGFKHANFYYRAVRVWHYLTILRSSWKLLKKP